MKDNYNYSELLKRPEWQKKRLEIMQRDGFKCKICDSETHTLHAHHINYNYTLKPWEYNDNMIITICENCHKLIHDKVLIGIINEGELSPYDFIQKYPYILFQVKNLINDNGVWAIDFHQVTGYFIDKIEILSYLCQFIKEKDKELYIMYEYEMYIESATNLFDYIKPIE